MGLEVVTIYLIPFGTNFLRYSSIFMVILTRINAGEGSNHLLKCLWSLTSM